MWFAYPFETLNLGCISHGFHYCSAACGHQSCRAGGNASEVLDCLVLCFDGIWAVQSLAGLFMVGIAIENGPFKVDLPIKHGWLVVWNMNFIFHNMWDVILPIDELHHFSRWFLSTNQLWLG